MARGRRFTAMAEHGRRGLEQYRKQSGIDASEQKHIFF
jgi:hypothetical protein